MAVRTAIGGYEQFPDANVEGFANVIHAATDKAVKQEATADLRDRQRRGAIAVRRAERHVSVAGAAHTPQAHEYKIERHHSPRSGRAGTMLDSMDFSRSPSRILTRRPSRAASILRLAAQAGNVDTLIRVNACAFSNDI